MEGWECFPTIVKPAQKHCSLDVTGEAVVLNKTELRRRVAYMLGTFQQPALIEDFNPRRDTNTIEGMILDVVRAVKASVNIPVAVKVGPFFSAMAHMANRLAEAGANGLVLFNRFFQPDLDLATLDVMPHLVLSTSDELRLPLRWVGTLYGRVPVNLTITSSVHTHENALKGLMTGAQITIMASELLQHGLKRLRKMVEGMTQWLQMHGYGAMAKLQSSMSQEQIKDPAAFEQANYIQILHSWQPDPAKELFRAMLR